MSGQDSSGFRRERIEKLLHELRYEIERGMLSHEVDETMGFEFYVPLSSAIPDGVVFCQFRTRPVPRWHMSADAIRPRLRLVAGEFPTTQTDAG